VEASGDGIPGHVPSDQIIMKPPTHGAGHTHCINEACGTNGHSFLKLIGIINCQVLHNLGDYLNGLSCN